MVTQADVDHITREVFRYMNSHPGIMMSFDNGFIKDGETFKKVFWVAVGKEPWPWEMLATRAETQSSTPQEAFEKATALSVSRLTPLGADPAISGQNEGQAVAAGLLKPSR